MNRFQAGLQARTVPEPVRRRLEADELVAKVGDLLRASPHWIGPRD